MIFFYKIHLISKGSTATRTGMGYVGMAVTGGGFFNDLASPIAQGGDLALYREGASLDSCFGHSAPVGKLKDGFISMAIGRILMLLGTQRALFFLCVFRKVDMKPYGLTHSTNYVGYSLFQCYI